MRSLIARTLQVRAPVASLALALLALPAAAHATTYYISPGGVDTNFGTQSSPWRTIAKANASLRPGDAVIIAPGTYTDQIRPANNGTSITQRISYIGNLSNPSQVVVSSIFLDRAYVSVKGVSGGGMTLYYTSETAKAVYDSIAWCIANSGGFGSAGAKNSVVAHNTINGTINFLMDLWYTLPPGKSSSIADTLRGNVIHIGPITPKGFYVRGFTQYCLVDSNRIDGMFLLANGSDVQCRYIYNSYYNTFRDNRWSLEADAPLSGAQYVGFSMRDSSHDNVFERDTMLCGVQSGIDIGGRLVNSGNANWVGQCINNRWKGCFYLTTGYTFNQDLLKGAVIENSVFASKHTYGLYLLGPIQNTIIRNCTVASWSGAAMKLEGDPRAGGNQFNSNVFFADSVGACRSGWPVLFLSYASGFTENNNLFYARTATPGVTASGQSIYWTSSDCSAPGAGTAWANATGNDINSKFGDPRFVNSTFANFNPHLQSGSLAIGLGAGGVDAGAYPFGSGGPDLAPPSSITSLLATLVSDQTVVLTWLAPGDDGLTGLASAYDLRYSTQPITDDASFAAATPVSGLPLPASPGTLQTKSLLGMTAGTSYYFSIKARDEANNWSPLGNVLLLSTQTTDTVAPKPIGDLR
jgi:hypothetical protein